MSQAALSFEQTGDSTGAYLAMSNHVRVADVRGGNGVWCATVPSGEGKPCYSDTREKAVAGLAGADEWTLEALWESLGDIPVNKDDEIEEQWLCFLPGTHKEHVWRWFERVFEVNAIDLLHGRHKRIAEA